MVSLGDNPKDHSQGACYVGKLSKPYFSNVSLINLENFKRT